MPDSILTVTVAATVRNLAELVSVKAELDLGDGADGADLLRRIRAVSTAIDRFCGRTLARETLQEVVRPVRALDVLVLSRYPVASITSIVADGATLVAGTDFEADLETGRIWRLSGDVRCCWRCRKITALYAAGYLLPGQVGANLPEDITRACIVAVTASYQAKGRDPLLRSEASQDVGQKSYMDPRAHSSGLPPQAIDLLRDGGYVSVRV
ncbi:MAG: hypothetical protein JWR10_3433 [Rubritepida sp.]|nr:hypothetical protein [Rubritepida sp.]